MTLNTTLRTVALACAAALSLPTLAHDDAGRASLGAVPARSPNVKPGFLTGPISRRYYDGDSDDLLTAGLGMTGLKSTAPPFVNPLAPTPAELRRNAIHTNYRAVLDISPAGGYGTLYGPNVTNRGAVTASEGKIAGWESIGFADDGSGRRNVTLMVQVPDSFDPAKPCIVTATSSGSRGIYGAIGASGEWGLKQGCAVAYTDKGTGNGLHDLMTNTVGLIDGTRTDAASAGTASHFTARLSEAERAAFDTATPHRVAYKHAHSQLNPEADWGYNTLQSVRFAFYVLNEQFGNKDAQGRTRVMLDRRNTIVIASGISNGGGAALAAAEQDEPGLIDGVAVTEPNAQPRDTRHLRIMQGNTPQPTIGKPLLDYFTYANLYQPCAAATMAAADSAGYVIVSLLTPTVIAQGATRCASLAAKGLVNGSTLAEQSADAKARLRAYGWLADSDPLQLSHYALATPAIAVTYSNAHARASVAEHLCGFSFANTAANGDVAPQNPVTQAGLFATGNGVPPTSGVNLIYNLAANALPAGAGKRDILAASPSTGALDLALDGALCQRALVTGDSADARRTQRGMAQVQLNAQLRGKPALIVHGRADALVPVNHSSRAYFGALQADGGHGQRNASYIEVTNAQHFDAFLGFPGYNDRYVPLHVYLIRALNAMYDHLSVGTALPPSQVVRTVPRGAGAPAIAAANVPAIANVPMAADRIVYERGTLHVPD